MKRDTEHVSKRIFHSLDVSYCAVLHKTRALAQKDKWERATDTLRGFPLILSTFIITTGTSWRREERRGEQEAERDKVKKERGKRGKWKRG